MVSVFKIINVFMIFITVDVNSITRLISVYCFFSQHALKFIFILSIRIIFNINTYCTVFILHTSDFRSKLVQGINLGSENKFVFKFCYVLFCYHILTFNSILFRNNKK